MSEWGRLQDALHDEFDRQGVKGVDVDRVIEHIVNLRDFFPGLLGAAPRAEGLRLDWIEITEEHEFGVEAMTEPRMAAGRRLLGEGLDRTTVAKVLHAMREGRGGLVSCYHGADGSECSYHAALFLATLARLTAEQEERHG